MAAQQTSAETARQAGWYADPLDRANLRYWDGQAWTDQTAARFDMPAPTGSPHPAPTRVRPGPGVSPAAAGTAYAVPPGAAPPVGVYSAAPANDAPLGYDPALGYDAASRYGTTQGYGSGEGYPGAPTNGRQGKPGRKSRRGGRNSGSVGLRANMFTTAAVVLGILAIVFMPLYLGIVAITAGALAFIRGERRAATGLKVAILGMIIGLVWAYVSVRFGIAL